MLNENNSENSLTSDFLHSAALDPNAIGPTFPPFQPFTLPTGPTGPTGSTGPTGPTGPTGSTGSTGRFILSLLIIINLSILLKR
ncbi:exosporium leader peptide-containing protein [Bacillus thuringiensis]|uniref:exosporium leader peptide-containing protein n=1 Tax=Bacillus thuringiensis TaxID=1428 RepID=UPI000BFE81B1|nr:exosporium leader peptide-containing protein [Bacillus thuringiensis]PGQ44314.1 hypothetical protein COA20_31285 [Bacillus thuringiensis]PGV71799.1 hypothetical protein COD84_24490 [Bacillus cereus]